MAQLLLAALLLVAAQLSPVALCRVLCQPTASGDAASPPANTTSPAGPCPPPGFGPVADLDLIAYASAPWYVQKQVRWCVTGPQVSRVKSGWRWLWR